MIYDVGCLMYDLNTGNAAMSTEHEWSVDNVDAMKNKCRLTKKSFVDCSSLLNVYIICCTVILRMNRQQ
jgi:hypothetical protein